MFLKTNAFLKRNEKTFTDLLCKDIQTLDVFFWNLKPIQVWYLQVAIKIDIKKSIKLTDFLDWLELFRLISLAL